MPCRKNFVGGKLALICAVDAKPRAPDDEATRFEISAYTGALMDVCGWDEPVVIDLSCLALRSQKIPVLYSHCYDRGVGHTESIFVRDGTLVAEGVVSRKTPYAEDFAASSKLGCPWQASVGCFVESADELREDEKRTVNGAEIVGPAYVVTACELREISIVEYGADSATSANVCCRFYPKEKEGVPMSETQNDAFDPSAANRATGTSNEINAKCKNDSDADASVPVVDKSIVDKPIEAAQSVVAQQPAAQPIEASQPASPPPVFDEAEILRRTREIEAKESERVATIRKICNGESLELERRAIKEGWSPDRCELEYLRAARPKAPAIHVPNATLDDGALVCAALRSAGMRDDKRFTPQQLEAADKYERVGIQELAELSCRQKLPRFKTSPKDWLKAAFSTTSFGYILSRVANASLVSGFEYSESVWREVAKIGSVNDFREHERYRLNPSFKFEKVPDGGTLTHGIASDEKFTQKVDTYGRMFALTRQMIANDDLGALAEIPRQIGMGAADTLNEVFWTKFLTPANANDGTAFYSAAHKNLLTGNPLDVDALTNARVAFSKQVKPKASPKDKDQPLGVLPSILLVPDKLLYTAQMLCRATWYNQASPTPTPADYNPHREAGLQIVTSAYLSCASYENASETAWYLLASPNRLPAFEVAFLDGKDSPTVEQADANFSTLGVEFRGFIDFGVREQDWRGILKVTGKAN